MAWASWARRSAAFGARIETGWAAGVALPRDKGDEELIQRAGEYERPDAWREDAYHRNVPKTKRRFTKHRKYAWGLASKALFELDYFYSRMFCKCNLIRYLIRKHICVIIGLTHHAQHHVTLTITRPFLFPGLLSFRTGSSMWIYPLVIT